MALLYFKLPELPQAFYLKRFIEETDVFYLFESLKADKDFYQSKHLSDLRDSEDFLFNFVSSKIYLTLTSKLQINLPCHYRVSVRKLVDCQDFRFLPARRQNIIFILSEDQREVSLFFELPRSRRKIKKFETLSSTGDVFYFSENDNFFRYNISGNGFLVVISFLRLEFSEST